MATCSKCSTEIPDGREFCPSCGTRQERPQVATCAGCGAELQGAFCSSCGRPATDAPSRRRRLPLAALAVIVAAVLAVTAASVFLFQRVQAARKDRIQGIFVLTDSGGFTTDHNGDCAGEGGYDDIEAGLQVLVKDRQGTTLAKGELGPGEKNRITCSFEFVVDDVPRSDFYEVSVGRRGSVTYKRAELEKNGWLVTFSLG